MTRDELLDRLNRFAVLDYRVANGYASGKEEAEYERIKEELLAALDKAALTDEIARLEKDVTQMIKIKRYWADRDIPDLVA